MKNIFLPSEKGCGMWKSLYFCKNKLKLDRAMTAMQINAELFRTMGEIADDEGHYDDK